ncbi:MAG TPA: heme o synthase [Actinomycetota bacterium]|jgi:protoheme IX farnesyltransferase|nr:heme o synthase [Actinomycetota bacterium]
MTNDLSRFRRLAFVVLGATLTLTSVGALVRATGSGLGCRDEWPKCAGGWIAPGDYKGIIEYSHRAAAGIVIVLVIASVVAARRWTRGSNKYFVLSLASLGTLLFQAGLGRSVVTSGLHAALVTAHFAVALALVGLTTWTAAAADAAVAGRPPASPVERGMFRMSVGALVALVPLLGVGAYVREKGAGLAFADWPLMNGRLVPSFSAPGSTLHFTHRVLALLVAAHLVVLLVRARRDERRGVRLLAFLGGGLFAAQAGIGAANVWTKLNPAAVVGHGSLAFLTWSAFVALVVRSRYGTTHEVPAPGAPPGIPQRALAYVALTKPRIIVLLLVTTIPAMVLAEHGLPSVRLMVATLIGGMLTAGSANALNQYLERDIDEKMKRTRSRPLPSHAVAPRNALVFAVAVGLAGFVWLALVVNLLSALLAAGAIVFYVGVYTLLLKRSTPQNIVIGGAAGAVPVLVGWAAVTGTVGAPAWIMFSIIFLWTPPHFWALAMRYRDDYAAAGVPMLPVVRGDRATTFQIVMYALVLVFATLLLEPVGGLGALYVLSAVLLGGGFIYRAIRLRWEPSPETALKLFRYSVSYLGLLFAAIAADRLIW